MCSSPCVFVVCTLTLYLRKWFVCKRLLAAAVTFCWQKFIPGAVCELFSPTLPGCSAPLCPARLHPCIRASAQALPPTAPGAEAPWERGEVPADVAVPGKRWCPQPRCWEVSGGMLGRPVPPGVAGVWTSHGQSWELLQDPGHAVARAVTQLLPQREPAACSYNRSSSQSLLRASGLSSVTQLGRGMLPFTPTGITMMKVGDNLIKLGFTWKNKDGAISDCEEWPLLV